MARLGSIVCAVLAVLHAWTFFDAGPLDDEYILYRYAEALEQLDIALAAGADGVQRHESRRSQ